MLEQGVAPEHWMGALLRNPALTLSERHLGLTVATELADALERLDAAADALAGTPLGRMDGVALQRWAVDFAAPEPSAPVQQLLAGRRIAVARDAAFCFIYQANLDTLCALGAELVFFSPLADAALPACDALWLPGGYPELHAQRLGANASLIESLRAHVAAGKPVWAECGGMMALFDAIVDMEGVAHAMWGLLPGSVTMQKRLAALGPQQLELTSGTLRGHTFHYSTAATVVAESARTARPGMPAEPGKGEAVYRQGSVRASYFHPWFPSSPEAAASLFLPQEASC